MGLCAPKECDGRIFLCEVQVGIGHLKADVKSWMGVCLFRCHLGHVVVDKLDGIKQEARSNARELFEVVQVILKER